MTKVERLFREFKSRMETEELSLEASRELIAKETRYYDRMVEQKARTFALETMGLVESPPKASPDDEQYQFFLLRNLYQHAYDIETTVYSNKSIKKALKVVVHLDAESLYRYLEKFPVDFRRYGRYSISHSYLISEDIIERFRNIEALYE